LAQIHPFAEPAAEAAEFAGAHRHFWEMHDGIYERQSQLSSELLFTLAKKDGLDVSAMAAEALKQRAFLDRVKQDFMDEVPGGVNGTPTFFVNGGRHDDGTDFESLAAGIEAVRSQLDGTLLPTQTSTSATIERAKKSAANAEPNHHGSICSFSYDAWSIPKYDAVRGLGSMGNS
jgi:hypothetical protein